MSSARRSRTRTQPQPRPAPLVGRARKAGLPVVSKASAQLGMANSSPATCCTSRYAHERLEMRMSSLLHKRLLKQAMWLTERSFWMLLACF